ncbi:hypothetical protein jhhlp_004018 [Lomentospora prolificans]|uniref:DUF8035 domain-containing protein n=1 Tax=Lomentospora prolificans TaxID=41688 RepID=A0A2N3NAE1_9PEZI|nr:hypothetical protein jhhlp_004018 [Lomentospora prolificans]
MSFYREEYGRPAESSSRTYVRERSRERSVERTPAFLREPRREAGPMVLRQREVETMSRPRRRSPSPVYVERERVVRRAHSVSPAERAVDSKRVVVYEHERAASPEPRRGRSVSRVRTRVIDRSSSPSSSSYSESSWSSSPSPPPTFRRRPRSASPVWKERERSRVRVVRREERSPSPVPPPAPHQPEIRTHPVERIEREVITHYRDIDHGVVVVRPPSPKPQPTPRAKSRNRYQDTEIDIYTSKNETEVDIRKSDSRSRSRSHHRPRVAYPEDHGSHDRLVVDYKSRRRAHSAAPMPVRLYDPVQEEAREITQRIDSRGRVGEAYHGATRDWTIVDVPPGTERVRMDGAGGASAEVSWQKYSGVRRTRFIPEREDDIVQAPVMEERPRKSRDSLSVHIVEEKKKSDRRVARPAQPTMETWTEITMDLVNREAIKRMGYPFEQRPPFFYVMQYLSSREIDDLVDLTAQIRRERRLRNRQRLRDQEVDTVVVHKHKHRHYPRHEDIRYDKQVMFDSRRDYI